MLVLSRKLGETFVIGDNILVTVVKINRDKIRLGIKASRTRWRSTAKKSTPAGSATETSLVRTSRPGDQGISSLTGRSVTTLQTRTLSMCDLASTEFALPSRAPQSQSSRLNPMARPWTLHLPRKRPLWTLNTSRHKYDMSRGGSTVGISPITVGRFAIRPTPRVSTVRRRLYPETTLPRGRRTRREVGIIAGTDWPSNTPREPIVTPSSALSKRPKRP